MSTKDLPQLMVLSVELPLVLGLVVMSDMTFIYRYDQGSIYDELCKYSTDPETLRVEGRVLIADHGRVIATIA